MLSNSETVHLRLGLEPTQAGLEPGQNPDWDLNPRLQDLNPAKTYSLPTEITHLVSGLNETQVLFFFFFKALFTLFIYLFLAVLGLRFSARAFSSCGKRGPLFIALRGPLTIAAPPVAGHRLQTRRLSNCGSRA